MGLAMGTALEAAASDPSACPAPDAVRAAHARPVLAPGERSWAMRPLPAAPAAPTAPAVLLPAPHSEERRHLLRRLTFVMSGLPPREDDAQAFLADPSPRALDKVVERLTASAAARQRLTEVWLRATGYVDRWPEAPAEATLQAAEAWRYRDWVVNALGQTTAPLALARLTLTGDREPGTRPAAASPASLTATLWHIADAPPAGDYEETVMQWASHQAERTSRTFLGLDLTCARCHDHPSLPLTGEEAAGLVAIFAHSHALVPGPDGLPALKRISTTPARVVEKRDRDLAALKTEQDRLQALRREFALGATAEFLPQTAEYVRAAWAWHHSPQGTLAAWASSRGLLEAPLARWAAALGLGGEPPVSSLRAPWWSDWVEAREQATPEAIAFVARTVQQRHQADENSPFFDTSQTMDALFTADQQVQIKRQTEKINARRRQLPAESQVPALAEGAAPDMEPPALAPQLPILLTGTPQPGPITPPSAGRNALATWLESEGAPFFTRLAALRLAEGLGHPLLPAPSSLRLWAAARPPEADAVDALASQLRGGGWPAAARHILRLQAAQPAREPLVLGASEWRDAVLFVTETLDPRQGGPPDAATDSPRRGLYREWAPIPSAPSEDFLKTQAAALAALARKKGGADTSVQLTFVTYRLFQRQPTAAERAQLTTPADFPALCARLLQSAEFRTLP